MASSWDEYLQNEININGIQATWNVAPHSRVDAQKLIVPPAIFFTPLKERPHGADEQPPHEHNPPKCANETCQAFCCYLSMVDFRDKVWQCAFCNQRNPFPPHYAAISEENRPPELFPQYSTIEYTLRDEMTLPPVFLFVADTCVTEEELEALKKSLKSAVSLLPDDAFVGFITFGGHIEVHDLIGRKPELIAANDNKHSRKTSLRDYFQKLVQQQQQPAIPSNKFLQPVSKCKGAVHERIDSIQTDQYYKVEGNRPLRATGSALAVAVTLLEVCFPNTGARIMMMVGGPCTYKAGRIVDVEKKNPIRSWHDIKEDNIPPYMRKAMKYYDALAARAVKNGHVIDVYSCALDQTGLAEMKNCYSSTNEFAFPLKIEYHKDDPNSLRLSEKFSLYPQFMFHLRRFLKVFYNNPDESAYYRHVLMQENVKESTKIFQPTLFSYSFNGPREPVLLDSSSILPDRILLMDDYFHVLIFHGQTIDAWRKSNFQYYPQYASFKQLLDAPLADAASILQDRFPVPRYIETEHEGSQARFFQSKVNPSVTRNNPYAQEQESQAVFTDDVSLQAFTERMNDWAVNMLDP